jgi:hypothetical protein
VVVPRRERALVWTVATRSCLVEGWVGDDCGSRVLARDEMVDLLAFEIRS